MREEAEVALAKAVTEWSFEKGVLGCEGLDFGVVGEGAEELDGDEVVPYTGEVAGRLVGLLEEPHACLSLLRKGGWTYCSTMSCCVANSTKDNPDGRLFIHCNSRPCNSTEASQRACVTPLPLRSSCKVVMSREMVHSSARALLNSYVYAGTVGLRSGHGAHVS